MPVNTFRMYVDRRLTLKLRLTGLDIGGQLACCFVLSSQRSTSFSACDVRILILQLDNPC